jgi:hypothetical protein
MLEELKTVGLSADVPLRYKVNHDWVGDRTPGDRCAGGSSCLGSRSLNGEFCELGMGFGSGRAWLSALWHHSDTPVLCWRMVARQTSGMGEKEAENKSYRGSTKVASRYVSFLSTSFVCWLSQIDSLMEH